MTVRDQTPGRRGRRQISSTARRSKPIAPDFERQYGSGTRGWEQRRRCCGLLIGVARSGASTSSIGFPHSRLLVIFRLAHYEGACQHDVAPRLVLITFRTLTDVVAVV